MSAALQKTQSTVELGYMISGDIVVGLWQNAMMLRHSRASGTNESYS